MVRGWCVGGWTKFRDHTLFTCGSITCLAWQNILETSWGWVGPHLGSPSIRIDSHSLWTIFMAVGWVGGWFVKSDLDTTSPGLHQLCLLWPLSQCPYAIPLRLLYNANGYWNNSAFWIIIIIIYISANNHKINTKHVNKGNSLGLW